MTPDPNYIDPALGWSLAALAWITWGLVEWHHRRRARGHDRRQR